jgi:hypothetical protein
MTNERKSHGRRTGPILALLFGLCASGAALAYFYWPDWTRNYGHEIHFRTAMFSAGLEQPIAFSHRLHVTDKQIDCFYCHSAAERSKTAGMPTAQKCLGCHNHVIPQHEQIAKLKDYVQTGREVPWERVYTSPDHVYFPHFRHLARQIRCQECHGEVERADRLRKVTFYMGFCLECHQRWQAPVTCTACHQ